jgi:outer membrane biosynthesis protein TonB
MLRKEESFGLLAAVVVHAGLLAVLVLRPPETPLPPPERITVTLDGDVGLVSGAPDAVRQTAATVAPELGETLPEPAEDLPLDTVEPETTPTVTPRPTSSPPPRATSRPAPRPTSRPAPRPTARATSRPSPAPSPRASSRPSPPAPRATQAPSRPTGGSRIGSDFLEGSGGSSTSSTATGTEAAAITPRVQSALTSQIARELKPHWAAPQGPDVEKIVTYLSFSLNKDGSLAGKPTLVNQTGVNDVNRSQAFRHAEQAIRAVELAAPFDLPPQYYSAWKRVDRWRFDRRF